MKKIGLMLCGTLAVCFCFAPLFSAEKEVCTAAEQSVTQKRGDFSDGFESYAANGAFIEEDENFAKVWRNNVLNKGEEQGIDAHLKGIAKVEYENGQSGNKVLHMKNAAVDMDSFFHIGPNGDYRIKNFTAGFRLKFIATENVERGWVGLSFRKKAMTHYTNTNNLLFTVQRYNASTKIAPSCYAVFNGGATNDFSEVSMQSLFGNKLVYTDSVYEVNGAAPQKDMPWVDYKLEAEENRYRMYIDNEKVADCTFDVNSYDYFGFLSINCCTANVLVDDFYVTVKDLEAPPEIVKLPAPTATFDEATKTLEWNRIAGANLYTVYLDGTEIKTTNKNSYVFDSEFAEGEHTLCVKAISEDTFEALDSELSVEIVYKVVAQKSGCKSVIGAGMSAAVLLTFVCCLKRKK